ACYLLWSYQRVFFGEVTVEKNRTLPDASPREKWVLVTMAVITLWMGISSPFFTRRFAAPSQNVLHQMQRQFPQEASGTPPVIPKEAVRVSLPTPLLPAPGPFAGRGGRPAERGISLRLQLSSSDDLTMQLHEPSERLARP